MVKTFYKSICQNKDPNAPPLHHPACPSPMNLTVYVVVGGGGGGGGGAGSLLALPLLILLFFHCFRHLGININLFSQLFSTFLIP